jgi:hypothetical protein
MMDQHENKTKNKKTIKLKAALSLKTTGVRQRLAHGSFFSTSHHQDPLLLWFNMFYFLFSVISNYREITQ